MLKTIIGRLLFVVVCLITLGALFYAEENWRGKHAWERYYRERVAAGDSLEWSAVAPAMVPDAENFAATPLFAELFPKPVQARLHGLQVLEGVGDWRQARVEDFAVFREGYLPTESGRGPRSSRRTEPRSVPPPFTGQDVMATLSKYDPVLREVTESSRLPRCRSCLPA